ncbi:hypothetical protein B0J18DRAFT_469653 [Chaetomium sp. MPI-SDFR-AT-0129]|nr:hypothetical protein B0J18DRAFT_469653 [Chaetomium sp. MPI-SDFR-AT-0129]
MPPNVDPVLRARQLLRFAESDHEHAKLISDEDLAFAHEIGGDSLPEAEAYPTSWTHESPKAYTWWKRQSAHCKRWLSVTDYVTITEEEHVRENNPLLPLCFHHLATPAAQAEPQNAPTAEPGAQAQQSKPMEGTPHLQEEAATLSEVARGKRAATSTASGSASTEYVPRPEFQLRPEQLEPPLESESESDGPESRSATTAPPTARRPSIAEQLYGPFSRAKPTMASASGFGGAAPGPGTGPQMIAHRRDGAPRAQSTTYLKPADVGSFNPSATDPPGAGLLADGKVNKYTDVFPFCDRLTDLAASHGGEAVRRIWTQCLQGPALVWHAHTLSDADREVLRTAAVAAICSKLKSRFQMDFLVSMNHVKRSRFSMVDVATGKDIMAFVQTVIRHAKACGMPQHGQSIAAFEALDGEIQSELPKPSTNTQVDDFLRQIQERESVLRRRARFMPQQRLQYPHQRGIIMLRITNPTIGAELGSYNAPRFGQQAPYRPAVQQQQPAVPGNRRLPAPPGAYSGQQQQQQGQPGRALPAFYSAPRVEDVPDEEFTAQDFGPADSYYGNAPYPDDEYPVAPDWLETDGLPTPETFPSRNKLMAHVYADHLRRPRPQSRTENSARKDSDAGQMEAEARHVEADALPAAADPMNIRNLAYGRDCNYTPYSRLGRPPRTDDKSHQYGTPDIRNDAAQSDNGTETTGMAEGSCSEITQILHSPIQDSNVASNPETLTAYGGYNAPTINPDDGVLASPAKIRRMGMSYPVLAPLVPYLGSPLSLPLACDLLELYFKAQHLDDVVACIHIGVIDRNDDDGKPWFSTAYSLAMEVGLGNELPSDATATRQNMDGSEDVLDAALEEMREERRRTWWLLYMVDRIFALYENRPPILLDNDVLQPMDEAEYQDGKFPARREPSMGDAAFECKGRSIYAHILPLMTILGEIMAQRYHSTLDYLINDHLEVYKRSLQRMSGEAQDGDTETQLIIAYGTLMARVLGMLMNEERVPSPGSEWHASRTKTTAFDAAAVFKEIGRILHLDPGLKFIQFFFGIFLFRGLWPLVQFPNQSSRQPTLDKLGKIVTAFDIRYQRRALSLALYSIEDLRSGPWGPELQQRDWAHGEDEEDRFQFFFLHED